MWPWWPKVDCADQLGGVEDDADPFSDDEDSYLVQRKQQRADAKAAGKQGAKGDCYPALVREKMATDSQVSRRG